MVTMRLIQFNPMHKSHRLNRKKSCQTHHHDKLNTLKMWAKSQYGQVNENMPLTEVEMSREETMQFLNGNIK